MAAHASPGVGLRPTGIEPRRPRDGSVDAGRRVETAIRVALAGGIAFQVLQRLVADGYRLSPYGRSLWYVSYQFGFVRRGLAGEILRRALGHVPTVAQVAVVQNAIAIGTLVAAALLVVVLCRRRTVIAYGVGALLVISPFAFDFVGGSRRPDLVSFLLLAAVAIWVSTGAREPVVVALVSGGLLAVSALCSEAGPLVVGPWLVLVVVCVARARGRSSWECAVAMALTAVPSALVLGVLAVVGRGVDRHDGGARAGRPARRGRTRHRVPVSRRHRR